MPSGWQEVRRRGRTRRERSRRDRSRRGSTRRKSRSGLEDRIAAKVLLAVRGGAGQRQRQTGDKQPEWVCNACAETNWLTRTTCRCCRAGRRGLNSALAQAAAAKQAPPATSRPTAPVPPPTWPRRSPPPPPPLPAATPAVEPAPQAVASKAERNAQREAEVNRVAAFDAALLATAAEDTATREVLMQARAAAAEKLASTKPLGQRLADARGRHERLRARLAEAEAEATRAAAAAQTLLIEEHAAAAVISALEDELLKVKVPAPLEVTRCAGIMLQWADSLPEAQLVTLPAELRESFRAMRRALPREEPSPSTPTEPADQSDSELEALRPPAAHRPARAASAGAGASQRVRSRSRGDDVRASA